MKQFRLALTSTALLLALVGCPQDSGSGSSHDHGDGEHAHGEGEDHPHGDGGHDHGGEGSDGVVSQFSPEGSDEQVGYLRLKLHDDKGDLELWLARDAEFAEPFDLPLDATPVVTFTDMDNRTTTLRVRNRDDNEDEDGKPNNRDGKTNYFIFPGDSGEDATWLKGSDFLATVKVAFEVEGQPHATAQFVLRPHTHGDGHAH